MVPELPQPPLHILVGEVLGCSSELQHFVFTVKSFTDIVDKESPDSSSVVGGGDGPVPLLAGSVPDLGFYRLPVNLNGSGGELHTNC